MTDATANYGLVKPEFNASIWHDQVNGNFDLIDALLFSLLGVGNFVGGWTNSTNYTVGQRVLDPDDASIWNCLVAHTSAATGVMSADRTTHSTYWQSIASIPFNRGRWQNNTVYASGDITYDPDEFLFLICETTHTSSVSPATARDDIANWGVIADFADAAISVTSVNGEIGAVTLDADDIDDSSTTNKFVTQTQLDEIVTLRTDVDSLLSLTGALGDIANKDLNEVFPIGMVAIWPATSAPSLTNGNGSTPAWLTCKGGTIGDGSSGAGLRANADISDLFTFLWTNFANTELIIQDSSGVNTTRGASAAADFAAHKRMPVPNQQGGTIYFADNSAGYITITGHSTVGKRIGAQNVTLTTSHIPANIPATFAGNALSAHSHNYSRAKNGDTLNKTSGGSAVLQNIGNDTVATDSVSAGTPSGTVTVNSAGGGTATPTLAPGMVMGMAMIKT